jgi:hypothetical protein
MAALALLAHSSLLCPLEKKNSSGFSRQNPRVSDYPRILGYKIGFGSDRIGLGQGTNPRGSDYHGFLFISRIRGFGFGLGPIR